MVHIQLHVLYPTIYVKYDHMCYVCSCVPCSTAYVVSSHMFHARPCVSCLTIGGMHEHVCHVGSHLLCSAICVVFDHVPFSQAYIGPNFLCIHQLIRTFFVLICSYWAYAYTLSHSCDLFSFFEVRLICLNQGIPNIPTLFPSVLGFIKSLKAFGLETQKVFAIHDGLFHLVISVIILCSFLEISINDLVWRLNVHKVIKCEFSWVRCRICRTFQTWDVVDAYS